MPRLLARTGIAFFLSMCACLAYANPLIMSVEPGANDGAVRIHLSNTSDSALSVLKWDTPFEDTLSHNVFRIEKFEKGLPFPKTVDYTGREVKRASPVTDNFMVLQPGETITKDVQLNEYYDIETVGEHRVRFGGPVRYESFSEFQSRSKVSLRSVASMEELMMSSNSVELNLTPNFTARLRPLAFNSCTVQQQTEISQASTIAETLTATALSDLLNLPVSDRPTSPRYTTWFGEYTADRYNTVTSNYDAIDRAFDNANLQFNCGCNEPGVYAFVYPALPYSVTLCPAFWSAPLNGLNSKAGTIIHEISHFTVVAGTDDHAYQVSATQRLAQTNPNLAIDNADNMEYFAENDPAIAIRSTTGTPTTVQYPALVAGTDITGSLTEGNSRIYQASGITQVELTSISGDADLHVFRDAQLSDEICESTRSGSSVDLCDSLNLNTVYIEVFAYTDTTFSLRAQAPEPVTLEDEIELQLDTPVFNSLAVNQRHIYQITNAAVVDLESITGDADLYIFSGLDLTPESIVCASANYSADSTFDSCNVPSAQSTYYAVVFGFTSSDYSIIARAAAPIDAIRLTAGQAIEGSISQGEFQYFVASGVDSAVLTSLSGDADLFVTDENLIQSNQASCVSDALSSISVVDSCEVPNFEDNYIVVFGYTDATFSLLARNSSVPVAVTPPENDEASEPAGDDPISPILVGSRSGGGSVGMLFILSLMSVAIRRSYLKS